MMNGTPIFIGKVNPKLGVVFWVVGRGKSESKAIKFFYNFFTKVKSHNKQ